MSIFKRISAISLILLCYGFPCSAAEQSFEALAYRIAGRAEIIRDRVESFHEIPSSKIPDLYYFIISTLEDAHGLYTLGDQSRARHTLVVMDTISYDVVCGGPSGVFALNDSVRTLQHSAQAGSLTQMQQLAQNTIGALSRRGLLESVQFVPAEEQYCAALFNEVVLINQDIKEKNSIKDVTAFFAKHCMTDADHLFFALPDLEERPPSGVLIAYHFDQEWGLKPVLYFETAPVTRLQVLWAYMNLRAFHEGFGINSNESLESRIHATLIALRCADFLECHSVQLHINDTTELTNIIYYYKSLYEEFTEESFVPGYYRSLFALKETPSLARVSFNWTSHNTMTVPVNDASADDYIFYLMGNHSQAPPNPRLVDFLKSKLAAVPYGTAYDLGSGDGRNTRLLAMQSGAFKKVIAIDHSAGASNRISRLKELETLSAPIEVIKGDICEYNYPDKTTPDEDRAAFILLDNVVEFLPANKRVMLFKKLQDGLLDDGVIFIEYHIPEGKKFEELKNNPSFDVDNDNTVSSTAKYPGLQRKHFITPGELMDELHYAGISTKKGFDVEQLKNDDEDGYTTAVTIIFKKNENSHVK